MALKNSKTSQFNGRIFPEPTDKPIETAIRAVFDRAHALGPKQSGEGLRFAPISVPRVKWLERETIHG
jgi:hypothetical protein